MRTLRLVPILLLCAAMSPAITIAETDRGDDRVSLRAIMIIASKQKGESDRRLAPYEPTLRRILRFESYRFIGEDTAATTVPGKGTLSLGRGHRLEFEAEPSDRRSRRVRVRWIEGGRVLMNTGLTLRPGVPAVLGGPPYDDTGEVYGMIVIAR